MPFINFAPGFRPDLYPHFDAGASLQSSPTPEPAERTVPVPPMPSPEETLMPWGLSYNLAQEPCLPNRRQQLTAKIQGLCETAWTAALDIEKRPTLTKLTCRDKSPNGYPCTHHNDGWHEARNGYGQMLETWEITMFDKLVKPGSRIPGLAELEADLAKPRRIPDPTGVGWTGMPINTQTYISSGSTLPVRVAPSANLRIGMGIDQAFKSSGMLSAMVGKSLTPTQEAKLAEATARAERQALVAKLAAEAKQQQNGAWSIPIPMRKSKERYAQAELEQIYREVIEAKKREAQAEAAAQQAIRQALATPSISTQALNQKTLALMAKIFSTGGDA